MRSVPEDPAGFIMRFAVKAASNRALDFMLGKKIHLLSIFVLKCCENFLHYSPIRYQCAKKHSPLFQRERKNYL